MVGLTRTLQAATVGMALLAVPTAALALPAMNLTPAAITATAGQTGLEQARFRGRGFGGGDAGLGIGLGILGGLIIGGALENQYQYGYYDGPVYSNGYCARRFRSYDPSSGTYLGYDGQRHYCR